MDSEDSRDGNSSSSSSSSRSKSRRSSSSDGSSSPKKSSKSPRSPPQSPPSPRSDGPRSPSPESQSRSPIRSPSSDKAPQSPSNVSGVHSDINSPEHSMSASPLGPKSHGTPLSPNNDSSDRYSRPARVDGPKTPQSPGSSGRSVPGSPRSAPESPASAPGSPRSAPVSPRSAPGSPRSAPASPTSVPGSPRSAPESPRSAPRSPRSAPGSPRSAPGSPKSAPGSPRSAPRSPDPSSQIASPDSASQATSPSRHQRHRSSSPSPDRNSPQTSLVTSKTTEQWRRHTKGEQKMVPVARSRSRSDSSGSSRSSSYNKRSNTKDPATEEISEGEMESDHEDINSRPKPLGRDKPDGTDLNISHEDLSDVSDLDSVGLEDSEKSNKQMSPPASPQRKSISKMNGNEGASTSPKSDSAKVDAPKLEKVPQEKTSNTEDGEEQLDFEAEEGECIEPKPKEQSNGEAENKITKQAEEVKPARVSRGSSLEEGEVSDEGERRPEESEPRPVCRFFSRGACTWGVSCRFLHPGVTDKGNYNMFDVVRGVPAGGTYAAPARDIAPPESAWERGLRTAKEMLRIANKRKEQDMDFEEKKLHLSVGGVVHDPDAELAYAAAAVGASPPPPLHHDVGPPLHREPDPYSRPYGMGAFRGRFPRPIIEERERFYERERPYERERVYERPPHYDERMPAPDEMSYHKRRVRSSREVIVQRAEVERREAAAREPRESRREPRDARDVRDSRDPRGDEWADPWMRAEPAARRRRPPSSDDSYSSSSSRSSRSPGRRKKRASSSARQRLSPSVIVRERRMASARATAMNPPAPRRRAPSPTAARQLSANPPPPLPTRHKEELNPYGRKPSSRTKDRKKYSRSSSSGSESSSSSSESESDSHSSSSSGSSGARRARHARLLNAAARPRLNTKSAGLAAAVTIPNKKEIPSDKESGKKRGATSPLSGGPAKKSVSRREELLKQLKAVEDAIARKRSKI